jgi:hypothetical protein
MCQCQRARSILTVKTNLMVQVGAESVVHIVAVALDILSYYDGHLFLTLHLACEYLNLVGS